LISILLLQKTFSKQRTAKTIQPVEQSQGAAAIFKYGNIQECIMEYGTEWKILKKSLQKFGARQVWPQTVCRRLQSRNSAGTWSGTRLPGGKQRFLKVE
jgi:hypothetical protein